MTIRVTVHHAHGENAPQDWRVEVLRPPKGQVVRSDPEQGGHVLEFDVASNTRELAYVWWPAWTEKPEDAEPIVLELAADSDQQEFYRDDPGEGDVPADEDTVDRADDTDTEPVETAEAGTAEDETDEGRLDELAQHVNQQLVRIWKAVEDVAYHVTALETGFAQHLALHEKIPIRDKRVIVEPRTPLEVAVRVAVAATTTVRDGFLDAGMTFQTRLGLRPGADGTTTAGRTLEQLTLAANAANSAIAVYEAEPSRARSRRNEQLALVAFAGKVQTAGQFYADTVAQVALVATRTSDPSEQSAFTDALMTLRRAPVERAIDLLSNFDADQAAVDETGARRTDRQGVPS
jgi:hypothetical protein